MLPTSAVSAVYIKGTKYDTHCLSWLLPDVDRGRVGLKNTRGISERSRHARSLTHTHTHSIIASERVVCFGPPPQKREAVGGYAFLLVRPMCHYRDLLTKNARSGWVLVAAWSFQHPRRGSVLGVLEHRTAEKRRSGRAPWILPSHAVVS